MSAQHRVLIAVVLAMLIGLTAGCSSSASSDEEAEGEVIDAVYLKDEGLFYSNSIGSFTAMFPADASQCLMLNDDGELEVIDAADIPDGAVVRVWDEDGIMTASIPAQLGQLSRVEVVDVNVELAEECREELGL